MANILIACNNDSKESLSGFLQSCADLAAQYCKTYRHELNSIIPPNLNENKLMSAVKDHQICFISAHGDTDGVYNEKGIAVISTATNNSVFSNKGFYSVACSCAQNLCPALMQIGLKFFVGYNNSFLVGNNEDLFRECALEGFKCILEGKSKVVAREEMLNKYDMIIKNDSLLWTEQTMLLHNREHLVFEGEDNVSLSDLV